MKKIKAFLVVCLVLWAFVFMALAAVTPLLERTTDVQQPMASEPLTFHQASSQELRWRFTEGTNSMNLTNGTNVVFSFSPSTRLWYVSVTGTLYNASSGMVNVVFTPTQLNTNSKAGTFDWQLTCSDSSSTLSYAYGKLSIVEDIVVSSMAAGLPAISNLVNWSQYSGYRNTTNSGPYRAGNNITLTTNTDGSATINASLSIGVDYASYANVASNLTTATSNALTATAIAVSNEVDGIQLNTNSYQTAYNWGNHAAQGYLKEGSNVSALVNDSGYISTNNAQAQVNAAMTTASNSFYHAGDAVVAATNATMANSASGVVAAVTNAIMTTASNSFVTASITNNCLPLDGSKAMTGNLALGGYYISGAAAYIHNIGTYPVSAELLLDNGGAAGQGYIHDGQGNSVIGWTTNAGSARNAFSEGGGAATFSWTAAGINMKAHSITNMADGVLPSDAATFGQIGAATQGCYQIGSKVVSATNADAAVYATTAGTSSGLVANAVMAGDLGAANFGVTNLSRIAFATNGVSMSTGIYAGTNAVRFTMNGTNYWIHLP